MKIAAQTVLWGSHLENLPRVLSILASNGCEGVEFGQRIEDLWNAGALGRMLDDYGITLLGLSGGSLMERVAFCGDALRPQYLYIESWEEHECAMAIKAGFTLALHPRLFKRVHRLEQAERLLREHPELRFLPDTAHLTIAGDSPAEAVYHWRERLAAIHIKDWTPIYGRSSHRYTRGYVALGNGSVNFQKLFQRLKEMHYTGWLVIEQADRDARPEHVLSHAVRWLSARLRIRIRKTRAGLTAYSDSTQSKVSLHYSSVHEHLFNPEEEKQFIHTAFRTAVDYNRDGYPCLAEAVCKLLKAQLVLLCTCSPAADVIGVVGVFPRNIHIGDRFTAYRGSLTNVAVERQVVTEFDLTGERPAALYGQPNAHLRYFDLSSKLRLKRLISVPVQDPQDPRQVRTVLNIFPSDEYPYLLPENLKSLSYVGRIVGRAADAALDERCAVAAATASIRAGECQQADAFLGELQNLLLEALRCETLTIFLLNDVGDRLEPAKTTGLKWVVSPEDQFYREGEGLTGKVWQRREALLSRDPDNEDGASKKSDEAEPAKRQSFLCAPMMDVTGAVIGVVRCQNKRAEKGSFQMFSEDDLAVFDSICQAAVPHMQVLISKERRAKALRRLTHELSHPLVALRGAVERMRTELERRRGATQDYFSEDYFGDIESWIALMRGLLGNANFFRLADRQILVDQRRVLLYGDVFMPAINQIKELLVDRDFESRHIMVSKFEEIPPLWLDKPLMTQVVFNLLSNAIKYAYRDPGLFKIYICGRETPSSYEIAFSDWGIGVPAEMNEAIFLEGVRTKEAEAQNVTGDGLGLWVARRVMEAHYGKIFLSSSHTPTTFTLALPKWLTKLKFPKPQRRRGL